MDINQIATEGRMEEVIENLETVLVILSKEVNRAIANEIEPEKNSDYMTGDFYISRFQDVVGLLDSASSIQRKNSRD